MRVSEYKQLNVQTALCLLQHQICVQQPPVANRTIISAIGEWYWLLESKDNAKLYIQHVYQIDAMIFDNVKDAATLFRAILWVRILQSPLGHGP